MLTFTSFSHRKNQLGRSTATTVIAVIVALAVLGGGAAAIYKLTQSEDEGTPVGTTARVVFDAWQDGDRSAAAKHMTADAAEQLFDIKPAEAKGLAFGSCTKIGQALFPVLCVWTRPGGQLSMRASYADGAATFDAIIYGPAALPPAGDDTPSG